MAKLKTSSAAAPLNKHRQKAHRYGLTTIDMQEVLAYLDAYDQLQILQEANDNSEWFDASKGLLCAAIVAYCRPFTKNFSDGFADRRLDATELQEVSERQALHNLLIEKRDTFIAHADWSARSAEILEVKERMVSWRFPQPDVWRGVDMKEFRRLIEGVMRECMDQGLKLAQAARDDEADEAQR